MTTEIAKTVATLRDTVDSGKTRPAAWRKDQLKRLSRLLTEGEDELCRAMREDLGKAPAESWVSELRLVQREITHMLRHLDAWMRPDHVHVPVVLQPARAKIVPEPLGVALVIAPWNYPVQLLLLPMASAIAAGNTVVGKPSELAPATSAVVAKLIPEYLDADAVAIVEGGVEAGTALLAERFDHIFYTGGARVARIVMEAAAKHLTPVTLELGGKSPAIVDKDVNLDIAARRLAYGKFVNAGQTCVAPDYVLVHADVERPLLDRLSEMLEEFYGKDPKASPDYGRIVNDQHFQRLKGLLDGGGYAETVTGGAASADPAERYLPPTIVRGVSPDALLMQEEIFGPILPVISVPSIDSAIGFVNQRPKPLSLYVFTSHDRVADDVLARTSSGSACVNTCIVQFAVPSLPIGGVGESGMGAYHGRWGFETFSHRKAVVVKPTLPEPPLQYPPYSKLRQRLMRKIY
jgi:aldehyde dehydrogenase (NAD+)